MSAFEALGAAQIATILLCMTAGACLQASLGFGLGLVAAPILVLVDASLVPAPLILNAGVLTALVLRREHRSLELGPVRWAVLGNLAGSGAAAAALTVLDARGFTVLFGALVWLGVLLSVVGLNLPFNRRNAAGAGVVSGFMGTTSSIGGPPMALLYQRHPGPAFRGNLAAYFLCSTAIALVALAAVGRLGWRELELSALLMPGLLLGFAISARTAGMLDGRALRPVVLGLSALSGTAVLVRALL